VKVLPNDMRLEKALERVARFEREVLHLRQAGVAVLVSQVLRSWRQRAERDGEVLRPRSLPSPTRKDAFGARQDYSRGVPGGIAVSRIGGLGPPDPIRSNLAPSLQLFDETSSIPRLELRLMRGGEPSLKYNDLRPKANIRSLGAERHPTTLNGPGTPRHSPCPISSRLPRGRGRTPRAGSRR
jgi:hypothetical protein